MYTADRGEPPAIFTESWLMGLWTVRHTVNWPVGATLKALASLYRLRHVIQLINPTQPVDWGLIAHHSGYSDQLHFSYDLMAFLGHSPTDYLRLRRQLYAANAKHDQLLRFLPID